MRGAPSAARPYACRAVRGFTLAELLVALVLLAVVSTGIARLTLRVIRLHRWQSERVRAAADLRTALAFLAREFRQLDGGAATGDIVHATATSITFRSMHGLYVVCETAGREAASLTVREVVPGQFIGLHPERDSLLVFVADGAVDRWLRVDLVRVGEERSCADGSRGVMLTVAGWPAGAGPLVEPGAPVRSFEMLALALYQDVERGWWLGARRWNRHTGWSRTQPVAGPLASDGLDLTYSGVAGRHTSGASGIQRIGVTLVAAPFPSRIGAEVGSSRALTTDVALRNSPWR